MPGDVQVKVWFDGSCPRHRRKIMLLHRLDRASTVTLTDLSASDAICPCDRKAMPMMVHLLKRVCEVFPRVRRSLQEYVW